MADPKPLNLNELFELVNPLAKTFMGGFQDFGMSNVSTEQFQPDHVETITDSGVTFVVLIPGASAEDFDVTVDNRTLVVSGNCLRMGRREMQSTPFVIKKSLPFSPNADSVKATLSNGVLMVTVTEPKTDEVTFTVKVES